MSTRSDLVTISAADLAQIEHLVETLEESALDAQRMLALDSAGWVALDGFDGDIISMEKIRDVSRRARLAALADPLIRRAVALSVAYVWGGGCTVTAQQEDGAEQDLNAVVQALYADEGNIAAWCGPQAREERERTLRHTGEVFYSLPTSPLSGRVQVRGIPAWQVTDIITNPEDETEVWYYERRWSTRVARTGLDGLSAATSTETRVTYYPDVTYRPARRPRTIDGHEIAWDSPVIHARVNPVAGRGTPDLLPALPWAEGFAEYLKDWARHMKALSRFAWKATAKTAPGASRARSAIATGTVDGSTPTGQTAIMRPEQDLTPALRSGAVIDADSGKPLAAMVAAATDIPVTMLLGDPGQTGARAVAETLTPAFENPIRARQQLHGDLERRVVEYAIREAVRAVQGPLKGTISRDPSTGREVVTLRGEQPVAVNVEFPRLSQVDVKVLVDAIVAADGVDKLPELLVSRLLLSALGVQDADDWLEQLVDPDTGAFVPPSLSTAAAAGVAAAQAARDGGDLDSPPGL